MAEMSSQMLLSTRLVDFIKFNLVLLRKALNDQNSQNLKFMFLHHLTWFLAEISTTLDKQVQMKLTSNLL